MLKVGLTGGMASGKSFVAAALGRLGCYIVEADEVGHEVISPGGEAYNPVLVAFGPDILDSNKQIDRRLLARKVFDDPAQLDRLTAIVHPAVRTRALRQFAEIGARDPHAIVVYVAAILIESGAYLEMDKIVLVACTPAQQIERAMQRPGATKSSVLARLERQMPLEEKRKFADYTIDSSGVTKEDTMRQTEAIFEDLRRLAV